METPTVRKQKSGDQLAPGDWLAPEQLTDGAAEVLHVLAYRPGLGASFRENEKHVHLLVRQQGKVTPYADVVAGHTLFDLATDEELARYREATERAGKIADIRAYADWLESNPDVPIGYGFGAQVDLHSADGIAQVKAFAAKLGGRYRDDLDDRTQTYVVVGSIEHRIIAWHPDGRPAEPKPLISDETIEQAGRMGVWNEREQRWEDPAAEHYEARGWAGPDTTGCCGVECACGVTYDGFDTLAEAKVLMAHHILDPAGVNYSRADEGETTQAVGRVEMHTGGVVEGDELVTDEAEAAKTKPVRDLWSPCVASLHIPMPGETCLVCGAEGVRYGECVQVGAAIADDEASAQCACGTEVSGFDSIAKAEAALATHIAVADGS